MSASVAFDPVAGDAGGDRPCAPAPQPPEQSRLRAARQRSPRVDTGRARHGDQSRDRQGHTADHEPDVRTERRRVVELHPAVDLEERLVQPPEARRVEEHERTVHIGREPARGPADEEAQRDQQRHQGEGEDQDRAAGPGAGEEGNAGEEEDLRQAEEEGGEQVVAEREVPDHLGTPGSLDHMDEEHRQAGEEEPDDHEEGHRPGELPPHVFPRGETGRVEDLDDLQLEVADHHHPARDGQEPGGQHQHDDRLDHALVVHGGDVRTVAADTGLAARHGHRPVRQAQRHQAEDDQQHPVRGTAQARQELPARDLPPPCEKIHERGSGSVPASGSSPREDSSTSAASAARGGCPLPCFPFPFACASSR